jgi:hypothetical protein
LERLLLKTIPTLRLNPKMLNARRAVLQWKRGDSRVTP